LRWFRSAHSSGGWLISPENAQTTPVIRCVRRSEAATCRADRAFQPDRLAPNGGTTGKRAGQPAAEKELT
jgi:hypothetical protein